MPATVSGFGNLLLPILASVPEMVFPKINNVGQQYSHILLACVVVVARHPSMRMHGWMTIRRMSECA